jgi:hypothetical protein
MNVTSGFGFPSVAWSVVRLSPPQPGFRVELFFGLADGWASAAAVAGLTAVEFEVSVISKLLNYG